MNKQDKAYIFPDADLVQRAHSMEELKTSCDALISVRAKGICKALIAEVERLEDELIETQSELAGL